MCGGWANTSFLVDNNTFINNTQNAIFISQQKTIPTNITNNSFSLNNVAINIENSNQTDIHNNIINSSFDSGLSLYNSYFTNFSRNCLSNNSRGIYLLDTTASAINNNRFFNNYLNNHENLFISSNGINTWNISNTTGINIVNGSSIGGNYWADLNNTGYSQSCVDSNSDGFCDSPFSIEGGNGDTDYFPLHVNTTVTPVPIPYTYYPSSLTNTANSEIQVYGSDIGNVTRIMLQNKTDSYYSKTIRTFSRTGLNAVFDLFSAPLGDYNLSLTWINSSVYTFPNKVSITKRPAGMLADPINVTVSRGKIQSINVTIPNTQNLFCDSSKDCIHPEEIPI